MKQLNVYGTDRLVIGARITGDFRAEGSSLDYRGARGNATAAANTTAHDAR